MNKKDILQKTKLFVKEKMSKDKSGHDYWHVIRVYKLAHMIAKKEKANMFVVQIAALLHDIGKHGSALVHTASCAKVANNFLKWFNLPREIKDNIADCILTHSWFPANGKPKTIEAKIIADCDAIDATGAIGVIRTAQYCGSKNIPVHDPKIKPKFKCDGTSKTMINHFYEKLLRLESSMYTKTAKYIVHERIVFMKTFLEQFLNEWEGKK